jgi:hypothetical protein
MTDIDTDAVRVQLRKHGDVPKLTVAALCDALDVARAAQQKWIAEYNRHSIRANGAENQLRVAEAERDDHEVSCVETVIALRDRAEKAEARAREYGDGLHEFRAAFLENEARIAEVRALCEWADPKKQKNALVLAWRVRAALDGPAEGDTDD